MEEGTGFEKSLFHFLLRRLGRGGSNFAVEHAIGLIPEHPDELDYILKYVEDLNQINVFEDSIVDQLAGLELVYWYPVFIFFEWRVRIGLQASQTTVAFARRVLYDANAPWYVKSGAREVLAVYGTTADLERFEQDFAEADSDLQQAEMICSLRRMERVRRNAFLGRVTNPGQMSGYALRFARSR
jgi:hypothetical protein